MLISISEVLETPVSTLLGETVIESKVDDLTAISEKLEIINLQLAQRKTTRRKIQKWFYWDEQKVDIRNVCDWEIMKFAAKGMYTGTGAGNACLKACIEYAKGQGINRIIIVSNRKCVQAFHLYRKNGFVEMPVDKEKFPFERADIAFEMNVWCIHSIWFDKIKKYGAFCR